MNRCFIESGIEVEISIPDDYNEVKSYPLVLLNDGEIERLAMLKSQMIVVGLKSANRLADYTPWKAEAIRAGAAEFGGQADRYHDVVFAVILEKLIKEYAIDTAKIAYGGYSLGGLSAIYSVYSYDRPTCIFSICGSFWFPGFVEFCKRECIVNTSAKFYLLNGNQEGAKHNNRLEQAPLMAKSIHNLLLHKDFDVYSRFDEYGHHEKMNERYEDFSRWLMNEWGKV